MNHQFTTLIFTSALSLMSARAANASSTESKPLELPTFELLKETPRKDTKGLKATCRTSTGRLVQAGDAGFEECVASAHTKPEPKDNQNRTNDPRGVDFSTTFSL